MSKKLTVCAVLVCAIVGLCGMAAAEDEAGVRDFLARWNTAYTGLNPKALASLETADYEMIDRFGHWIKSEGPEFNERLWTMAFNKIYRGKPGPARQIEAFAFLRLT